MGCSSALEKSFVAKKPLFDKQKAILEAERCLYCYDAPCITACPTSIDIPRFIRSIAEEQPMKAAQIILQDNILGYSCARVCPTEVLCASACVLHHRHEEPIDIGSLQHFATDLALATTLPVDLLGHRAKATNKRVACIGAGSASLAMAAMLALKGHRVEIFEKGELLGGLNALGIAPYKLYYDDAIKEIEWLKTLGIVIHENRPLAKTPDQHGVDASFLLSHFDAVFLGLGIGDDQLYGNVPKHPRIFGATEFVRRLKTDPHLSLQGVTRAHVIGGGNTAVDVVHELALLKVPFVTLVYRKGADQMSAYEHEIKAALHDGVQILSHTNLREVLANTVDGPLDLRLQSINHSECEIYTSRSDLLVFAIGQKKDLAIVEQFAGLALADNGCIKVDPQTFRTGNQKVWAGGDCVNGGKEVVNAVAEAKVAVASMHAYLVNDDMGYRHA